MSTPSTRFDTPAECRLLAWPLYSSREELEHLLREFCPVTQRHREEVTLCLLRHPEHDPPREKIERRLDRARKRVLGRRGKLDYVLADAPASDDELGDLGQAVTWVAELPSSALPDRTAFHLAVGASRVRSGAELLRALERRPTGEVYGETRRVSTSVGGRRISLSYPHTPGVLPYLQDILSGQEYPLFLPGTFAASVVVDVGGHIGCSALWFAAAFPSARIYTFEPAKRSFEFLETNVAQCRNIRAFPFGLFSEDRDTELHHGATSSMQSSLFPGDHTRSQGERIELHRASDELRRLEIEAISILKIDTEGCEVPILQDIRDWLARTDFLYVEYHSEADRREIERMLASDFLLCSAAARGPHRGSNAYVSRRIVDEHPELGDEEIVGTTA